MQLHLEEISRTVARGAHAVLLLDRAGWHTTANLIVPKNLTLVFLPSRAPELNPVENICVPAPDLALQSRLRHLRRCRRCRLPGVGTSWRSPPPSHPSALETGLTSVRPEAPWYETSEAVDPSLRLGKADDRRGSRRTPASVHRMRRSPLEPAPGSIGSVPEGERPRQHCPRACPRSHHRANRGPTRPGLPSGRSDRMLRARPHGLTA